MLVPSPSIRILGLKRGGILDETCPLENAPQERFDAYGFGKLKQEEVVREYGSRIQTALRDSQAWLRLRTGKTRVKRPCRN